MKLTQILENADIVQQLISNMGQDVLLTYEVEEKLLGGKKNEMLGRVSKRVSNIPCQLAGQGDYKSAMTDSGKEEYAPTTGGWGSMREDGLIDHKGELYVEYISKGRPQKVEYFLDGTPIDKSEIVGLKPSTTAPDQETSVIVRRVKVKSIISVGN